MGEAILTDYSDGLITAVGVVKYARYAQRDGLSLPMLDKFAACGIDDFQNCARHFKDLLRENGAEDYVIDLDGPVFKNGVLPSSVIKLIARSEHQFKMRLAPSADECQLFWEQFFSSPDGLEYKSLHPHLRHATAQSLRNRFPIRIHEDQAPYSKRYGVDCLSCSSL